jgi:hypothetical protein
MRRMESSEQARDARARGLRRVIDVRRIAADKPVAIDAIASGSPRIKNADSG